MIHKSEPEPSNGNVKILSVRLFVWVNIRISCTEFVYNKQAHDCKWLPIFVLPG